MRRDASPPCTSDPLVRQGKPDKRQSIRDFVSRNRSWNSHRPVNYQPEFMENALLLTMKQLRPKTRRRNHGLKLNHALLTTTAAVC